LSLLFAGIITLKGKTNYIYSGCPKLASPLQAEFRKTEIEERLWSALQLRDSPVRSFSGATAETRGGLAPSRLTAPERDAKPRGWEVCSVLLTAVLANHSAPSQRDYGPKITSGSISTAGIKNRKAALCSFLWLVNPPACQHTYRCGTISPDVFLASKYKRKRKDT